MPQTLAQFRLNHAPHGDLTLNYNGRNELGVPIAIIPVTISCPCGHYLKGDTFDLREEREMRVCGECDECRHGLRTE
jgi:hypothetical protein